MTSLIAVVLCANQGITSPQRVARTLWQTIKLCRRDHTIAYAWNSFTQGSQRSNNLGGRTSFLGSILSDAMAFQKVSCPSLSVSALLGSVHISIESHCMCCHFVVSGFLIYHLSAVPLSLHAQKRDADRSRQHSACEPHFRLNVSL